MLPETMGIGPRNGEGIVKGVLLPALLGLTLAGGCATNNTAAPQTPGQKLASSKGVAPGYSCSQERRTGTHMATTQCVSAETARERREAAQDTMRRARISKPAGGAAGQN